MLKKPVLSVPLRHQDEQALNALWLAELGHGRAAHSWTTDGIKAFLDAVAAARFRVPDDDELRRLRAGTALALETLHGLFDAPATRRAA